MKESFTCFSPFLSLCSKVPWSHAWVGILALPPKSCVTLGRVSPSVPVFLPWNGMTLCLLCWVLWVWWGSRCAELRPYRVYSGHSCLFDMVCRFSSNSWDPWSRLNLMESWQVSGCGFSQHSLLCSAQGCRLKEPPATGVGGRKIQANGFLVWLWQARQDTLVDERKTVLHRQPGPSVPLIHGQAAFIFPLPSPAACLVSCGSSDWPGRAPGRETDCPSLHNHLFPRWILTEYPP